MRIAIVITNMCALAACGRASFDGPGGADDVDAGADAAAIARADAAPGDRIACAMPLLSRGQVARVSGGEARGLTDGVLGGFVWSGAAGDWAALDVGVGHDAIAVAWTATDAPPRAYTIETSADSTDGADGTWTSALAVTDNTLPTRAHVVRFTGQRWLRVRLGGDGALYELAVHDASHGACDTWLFVGDSITALAYNLSNDFSDDVHAARGATYPVRLGIGVGGTSSQDGLDHVDAWLAAYPDVANWVVSYGSNDTGGSAQFAPAFGDRMIELVGTLQRAGKRVYVPRLPFATYPGASDVLPAYVAQIDRVIAATGATPGPDLYAYFGAHPDQLADHLHPNGDGGRAMNQLWADVALPLYR